MAIQSIALIGAGAMGMGIAQIAAQAGLEVRLYDLKEDAAEIGLTKLKETLEKLCKKGKLTEDNLKEILGRFKILNAIDEVVGVDLIIEAIVENLEIKQDLFKQLEEIVPEKTILATNTSSLSVTEIASALKYQERFVGFHFFNPVPLMKIVEIIAGLATDEQVIIKLLELAKRMGHFGVKTKDTPGFIVNHAGRAYGTEALKILGEKVATVSVIDRILRDGVGFRMGPLELFDLTALDVSHPVMESIFNQYYQEDRYRPSPITRQMLAGKKIGRKVGEGFYIYQNGEKTNEEPVQSIPTPAYYSLIWIGTDYEKDKDILTGYIQELGLDIDTAEQPRDDSLILLATYGEDTTTAALRFGVDTERTVSIDMLTDFNNHRTLMPSINTRKDYIDQAHALFAKNGHDVSVIGESVGFVAQRVLAMIVNLACDMAQQGIANVSDIDKAVRLGLGYPYGPVSWGDELGANRILLILDRMLITTGDQRYRPSPWLQRRARLNLSLFYTACI